MINNDGNSISAILWLNINNYRLQQNKPNTICLYKISNLAPIMLKSHTFAKVIFFCD